MLLKSCPLFGVTWVNSRQFYLLFRNKRFMPYEIFQWNAPNSYFCNSKNTLTYFVFHFSFLATIHFTHSQLAISILKVPSCMADWLGWSNKQLWKFSQHINLNNYNWKKSLSMNPNCHLNVNKRALPVHVVVWFFLKEWSDRLYQNSPRHLLGKEIKSSKMKWKI